MTDKLILKSLNLLCFSENFYAFKWIGAIPLWILCWSLFACRESGPIGARYTRMLMVFFKQISVEISHFTITELSNRWELDQSNQRKWRFRALASQTIHLGPWFFAWPLTTNSIEPFHFSTQTVGESNWKRKPQFTCCHWKRSLLLEFVLWIKRCAALNHLKWIISNAQLRSAKLELKTRKNSKV